MNINTCCFTGHRKLPTAEIPCITAQLDDAIERVIALGVTTFLSGGASGFDLLAASRIISRKNKGQPLRLYFILPYQRQNASLGISQKNGYETLLSAADGVTVLSENDYPGCFRKRNEHLVNHSSYCICALIHEKSGTGQIVCCTMGRHQFVCIQLG